MPLFRRPMFCPRYPTPDRCEDTVKTWPCLVGNDTRSFVKARQELPVEEYVEFMRSRFRPKSGAPDPGIPGTDATKMA